MIITTSSPTNMIGALRHIGRNRQGHVLSSSLAPKTSFRCLNTIKPGPSVRLPKPDREGKVLWDQSEMQTTDFDIAIVGGGHNGLVAASYLAREGYSVGVFERRHLVGGKDIFLFVFCS